MILAIAVLIAVFYLRADKEGFSTALQVPQLINKLMGIHRQLEANEAETIRKRIQPIVDLLNTAHYKAAAKQSLKAPLFLDRSGRIVYSRTPVGQPVVQQPTLKDSFPIDEELQRSIIRDQRPSDEQRAFINRLSNNEAVKLRLAQQPMMESA